MCDVICLGMAGNLDVQCLVSRYLITLETRGHVITCGHCDNLIQYFSCKNQLYFRPGFNGLTIAGSSYQKIHDISEIDGEV